MQLSLINLFVDEQIFFEFLAISEQMQLGQLAMYILGDLLQNLLMALDLLINARFLFFVFFLSQLADDSFFVF